MSDPAPFVAFAIRDKVVLQQQEEIKNFKRKFDDFVANQRALAIKEVTNWETAIYGRLKSTAMESPWILMVFIAGTCTLPISLLIVPTSSK